MNFGLPAFGSAIVPSNHGDIASLKFIYSLVGIDKQQPQIKMAKIVFYFRTFLYSVTLLTVSFMAVGIGLLCTLFGKRLNTNYYVARTFYYIAGVVMGWTFVVEGEEHLDKGLEGDSGKQGRSAVMVGNHQR